MTARHLPRAYRRSTPQGRIAAKRDLIVVLARKRLPAANIALALDLDLESVRRAIYRLRAQRRVFIPYESAWCPPEHRASYLRLRDRHGAAEARRLVERDLIHRRAA